LALAPVEDAGSARRFAGQETGPLALKRTTQSRCTRPRRSVPHPAASRHHKSRPLPRDAGRDFPRGSREDRRRRPLHWRLRHRGLSRCARRRDGTQVFGELALAALSHLRKNLGSRNAARIARSLGTGGATGLGSIVYALAVMAKSTGRISAATRDRSGRASGVRRPRHRASARCHDAAGGRRLQSSSNRRPQSACWRGARLARLRGYHVLRHIRKHRILLRGGRRPWPQRSSRPCVATDDGDHGNRVSNWRLSMECRQQSIQSGLVPRPCGCWLHGAAARRRFTAQHTDLE
jgi:hypothetical protein